MNRNYTTGTHDTIKIFTGTEVEHTPAYGLKTLFVVGIQGLNLLQSTVEGMGIEHIYFGANHSFHGGTSSEEWKEWDDMISPFLATDIWVSLDFDINYAEAILEEAWVENDNFIPVISCKLPYLKQLGYNACIKLDDKDFNATNDGVWVHSLHDLLDRKRFTRWATYEQDKPL